MSTTKSATAATFTIPTDREVHIERCLSCAPRARVASLHRSEACRAVVGSWAQSCRPAQEVERGGHWRFVEHTPGGPQGFEGRYREVSPPHRLVNTFEWDGMPGHVAINGATFEDLGDGRTKVVTKCQFHTTQERDGMLKSGWESGLNESYVALDKLLAALW
jgi:uncharacterized protein YndB with AHSA1/START domain